MLPLDEIKDYVPRHMRLGVCVSDKKYPNMNDVKESVPVVDDNGVVVETRYVLRTVPAEELMSQYKVEDFRLSALVRAGVPLQLVNVNNTSSFTIDRLERICQNVEDVQLYVDRLNAQRAERESWFKPVDDVEPLNK